MTEEKNMVALPLWKPTSKISFNPGMMYNSAFIVTQSQQRSDLGECIICTRAPHYVAKVHVFKTTPTYKEGKDGYNEAQLNIAQKYENERKAWLQQRADAIELSEKAACQGISIQQLVEQHGTYDEEFDEPRLVAKVPGLNVYLELFGCLDPVTEIDWDGEFGAEETLRRMTTWIQNNWTRRERRPMASKVRDLQPVDEWHENYDETLRPFMPRKAGIGVWPCIDASRRPELLYSKAPRFDNDDLESILLIKQATADAASKGLKRK